MSIAKRLHYAWIIAAACFVMFFVTYGLTNNSNNLYMIPITESLGIGRGAFSLMFSFKFVVQCLFTLFFGWFSARLGSRNMMIVGFLLLISACLVISMAQGLVLVYLSGALQGAGMAFASLNVVTVLLRGWFVARRGLVIGVVMASTGLGGAFFSPLVGLSITSLGWRTTYRFAALILLVVGAAVVFAIREHPEDCGLKPLGAAAKAESEKTRRERPEAGGVTFAQALKMPYFYACIALTFLFGILNNPVHTSAPAHLIDSGFSLSFAASVGGALFLALAGTKVLLGEAYDRLGALRATTLCLLANFAGVFVMFSLREAWQAWLYALLFAFSIPLETVTISLLVTPLFGQRDYKTFLGILAAGCQMGIAVGNPLLNFAYDSLGSYRGAYAVMAGLSLATLALFTLIMKRAAKVGGE